MLILKVKDEDGNEHLVFFEHGKLRYPIMILEPYELNIALSKIGYELVEKEAN